MGAPTVAASPAPSEPSNFRLTPTTRKWSGCDGSPSPQHGAKTSSRRRLYRPRSTKPTGRWVASKAGCLPKVSSNPGPVSGAAKRPAELCTQVLPFSGLCSAGPVNAVLDTEGWFEKVQILPPNNACTAAPRPGMRQDASRSSTSARVPQQSTSIGALTSSSSSGPLTISKETTTPARLPSASANVESSFPAAGCAASEARAGGGT
mmetsp:Transcript_4789/g.8235  ORF Transcript_4789/g.8235 Transcript_4789/m.8235 type:complete len:206 (+) Transcript_4789:452-1069(+)